MTIMNKHQFANFWYYGIGLLSVKMCFNIISQLRIHTSFHRFMEISQIFYKKLI